MKNNKRTLALLTAGLLAVTPMAATGLTAIAAGTSTLTITDSDPIEHSYYAYQIIKGEDSGGKMINLSWGAGVNSATLISALRDADNVTALDITAPAANASVEDIATLLSGITDPDKLQKLSKIIAGAKSTNKTSLAQDSTDKTMYSSTGLDHGWYLVLDESSPLGTGDNTTDVRVKSANILKFTGDTTVNSKHSLPVLTKKILEDTNGDTVLEKLDANTAAIGDVITYDIETEVPNLTGYEKYFLIVEDTLSSGLTFNNDISVKVATDPTITLTLDTDGPKTTVDTGEYYVTTEAVTGGTKIKVVFKDVVTNFANITAGTKININYTATLNQNAEISPTVGNPNKAKLIYSNDPNKTNDGIPATSEEPAKPDEPNPPGSGEDSVVGETPEDKVNTYTTAIKIKKVDQDGQPLKGVTFKLIGTNLNKVETVSGATFTADNTSGTYWKLKNGSYTQINPAGLSAEKQDLYESTTAKYTKTLLAASEQIAAVATGDTIKSVSATVDDSGILTFTGLDAGDYILEETDAPSGYNKALPISFTISYESISEDRITWTNSSTDFAALDSDNMFPTTIVNKQGSTLPSTGGMGTRLFYIIGGLLVAGSLVLLVTKKRMSKEN